MGALTDVVRAWARESIPSAEISTQHDGDRATLNYNATGDHDQFSYRAFFEITESKYLIQFFLYAPIKVPMARRQPVAEAIVRFNHNFLLGYLDLDMEDGGIRYYAAMMFKDGALAPPMLEHLQVAGVSSLDQALPALMAVAFGTLDPAEALDQSSPGELTLPAPDLGPAPPWERLTGADVLQQWAYELMAARVAKDAEEWRLAGQGVVLLAEDFACCLAALRRVAAEAGYRLVMIEADDVMDMPAPSLFAPLAPVLLYLAPGRWSRPRQGDETPEWNAEVEGFQRKLAQWVRSFDLAKPVVYVTSARQPGKMADVLDGPGRFNRCLVLPPPSLEALGENFLDDLGRARCAPSLLEAPGKLGKIVYDQRDYQAWRSRALLFLQRLHRRTGQPLRFLDLMYIETHGFVEEGACRTQNAPLEHQRVATHEAGHAAVAILDSGGRNIPDYCSIVPGVHFKGVVHESVAYHQSLGDRRTFMDLRHDIRISLGGRIAEEMVFGPEQVSSGAASDLENCYNNASTAFFYYGYAPDMGAPGASASNLCILVGTPSPSEFAHNEKLVRRFLASEYAATMMLLKENRALFNAIADRLMRNQILDQTELQALCTDKGIVTAVPASKTEAGQP